MLQLIPGGQPFPETPLLLEPVKLPWRGALEGVTLLYDVEKVRELVDTSWGQTISIDLLPRRAEILSQGDRISDDQIPELDDSYLEEALRIIQVAVFQVEWPFSTPPPNPADPLTFTKFFNDHQIYWMAGEGVSAAAEPWVGPLSLAALQRTSMRTMGRRAL